MRVLKPKKVIPLDIPAKTEMDAYLVVGIDPSLSRTGYALSYVKAGQAGCDWLEVGSVKPSDASEPIWVRGKAMALFLRKRIEHWIHHFHLQQAGQTIGLIISMEYPTPMNDFLVALNRIIHLVFFEDQMPLFFHNVNVLTTNASTLRSLMNLTMRGSKNKVENIQRAYEYINRTIWPSLDTDSCDAVLLSVMAHHAANIYLGRPETVPERFKISLCNATKEVKGKGTRARIITKGILHRHEYWYPYNRKEYTLLVKDATNPKPGLKRENFTL